MKYTIVIIIISIFMSCKTMDIVELKEVNEDALYIQARPDYDNPFTLAMTFYDLTEIPGKTDNNSIISGWNKHLLGDRYANDETSWCSSAHNAMHIATGFEYSGKANARSWLYIGYSVKDNPKPGDTVIFWRDSPDSWKGHVAFFIAYSNTGKYIWCYGGNQSNKYIASMYRANRMLDIRRMNRIISLTELNGMNRFGTSSMFELKLD